MRVGWWVRRRSVVGAAALATGLLVTPADATPPAPIGNWLTADHDAVIAIDQCGNALCGRIVGIPLAIPGEPIPTDNHGRSQCQLTIIWDGKPDATGWMARILDPRDGGVYSARLHLDPEGRLRLRGYLGIPLFGRTQVWTPFTGAVPANCRLPPRVP